MRQCSDQFFSTWPLDCLKNFWYYITKFTKVGGSTPMQESVYFFIFKVVCKRLAATLRGGAACRRHIFLWSGHTIFVIPWLWNTLFSAISEQKIEAHLMQPFGMDGWRVLIGCRMDADVLPHTQHVGVTMRVTKKPKSTKRGRILCEAMKVHITRHERKVGWTLIHGLWMGIKGMRRGIRNGHTRLV